MNEPLRSLERGVVKLKHIGIRMIDQWNFDMDTAPRGRIRIETRKFGNGTRDVRHVDQEWVWVALDTGLVYRTHWVEPNRWHVDGRWAGLHHEAKPIAWMPFRKPCHPKEMAPVVDSVFRQRELDLALILIRKSTNAHAYINSSILSERVDSLSDVARKELSETLINLGKQFGDG